MNVGGCHRPLVFGNFVETLNVSSVGVDTNGPGVIAFGNAVFSEVVATGVRMDGNNGLLFGNNIVEDVEVAGNNNLVAANIAADPITVTGEENILSSNRAVGGIVLGALSTQSLLVANRTATLDLVGTAVVVGNVCEGDITYTDGDMIFAGNFGASMQLTGGGTADRSVYAGNKLLVLAIPALSEECTVVGNWISDTASTTYGIKNSAIAGNVFMTPTMTLSNLSENVALVGNYLADPAVSDLGTDNVDANNS